ncbi:periplasmic heavy metal sensor [Pseudomonas protegens]|nr:periplasmic heavy metal sensor [Pseudomonas protegens]MBP5105052.1 periplasmic heavy metal sensor [Pseudomonas protegens]MBP5133076.1 periplasmic heavy metal sensor [Pseudomonas protegens]MBP5146816.1 periplasmic heavy metal sensor [Pseudomonas protegens]NTZ74020.1 periplasmic heavy metal sensor [Pseudomonas protegens]
MSLSMRALKTCLVLSLLINVFLIGGVAGGLYQWLGHPKPAQALAVPLHGLRQAMAQMPEERRRQLRQLLRQTRIDSQPLIIAGREARQAVVRELGAEPLDRNALDAQLGKSRDADIALRARVDEVLAGFAGSLSLKERQQLVDAMYLRGPGKNRAANKD